MSRTKPAAGKGLKRKHEGNTDVDHQRQKKAAKSASPLVDENREAQELENDNSEKAITVSRPVSSKKPKKASDTKDQDANVPGASKSPVAEEVDDSITHMDSSLLADHFAKQIKRHFGDLSTVELDKKYLPAKAFLNTSEFESPRLLDCVPSFLEQFTPGGKDELMVTAESTSSPHTLFIASSGLRAADLTRLVLYDYVLGLSNMQNQGTTSLQI